MRKMLLLASLVISGLGAFAQIQVTKQHSWESVPPDAQKRGFGLNKTVIAQMDADQEEEQVLLFTTNNGHYPYFDLFKCYYAVVGNYSKQVKYVSDVYLSTSRDIVLEDRNKDGIFELYRKYIKDSKFTVDDKGNNLKVEWVYDTIEFLAPKK